VIAVIPYTTKTPRWWSAAYLGLYTLFDLTHINQVYLIFRARLLDRDYMPGEETVEVRLLAEKEIPWDDIAFPSIKKTLRLYFKDRPTGVFPLHMGTIPPFKKT
jgi:hypothetical protein